MHCTQCGEPVLPDEKFCANCGSALPAGQTEPEAPDASQMEDTIQRTRAMNIVGAAGFGLMGLVVLVMLHGEMPKRAAIIFSVSYVFILATPVASIFALSNQAGRPLRILAFVLNAAMIALWCVSFVSAFFRSVTLVLETLFAVLFYVGPQVINIQVLCKLLKGRHAGPGGNDGRAP